MQKKPFLTYQQSQELKCLEEALYKASHDLDKVYKQYLSLERNLVCANIGSVCEDKFRRACAAMAQAQMAAENAATRLAHAHAAAWYQDAVYRMREDGNSR